MVIIRGRLAPEVGAMLVKALDAARETLYQQSRSLTRSGSGSCPLSPSPSLSLEPGGDNVAENVPAETPVMAQQQADALALVAETALHHGIRGRPIPGGRPRRRAGAGGYRRAGRVSPRGRHARSRRNVPPPGVRREPGGDATRRGRQCHGDRRAHPHDPAGVTARAPAPRPGLSLPGLRSPVHSRTSHPALGERRAHDTVESRVALSPSSPRSP